MRRAMVCARELPAAPHLHAAVLVVAPMAKLPNLLWRQCSAASPSGIGRAGVRRSPCGLVTMAVIISHMGRVRTPATAPDLFSTESAWAATLASDSPPPSIPPTATAATTAVRPILRARRRPRTPLKIRKLYRKATNSAANIRVRSRLIPGAERCRARFASLGRPGSGGTGRLAIHYH